MSTSDAGPVPARRVALAVCLEEKKKRRKQTLGEGFVLIIAFDGLGLSFLTVAYRFHWARGS